MILVLILFHLSALCSQASQPPINDDFRYDAIGLQVYFDNGWYYIQNSFSFGYIEANRICELFLNSTLLSYSVVSSPNIRAVIDVSCSDGTFKVDNCELSTELVNFTNEVINITCREISPDDRLVQLKDRAIAVPTTVGDLSLWGQFCYYNNNGWDRRAATLACNSLGYNGVTPVKEKQLVRKGVLGLENINCENAFSFDECTFSVTTRFRGRCDSNKVITIQCTNDVATSRPSTSIANTVIVSDTAHTDTISRSVSYHSTTYTSVAPTHFLSASENWMFIGAGVVSCVILVNIGALVLLFLCCFLCLKKKQPEVALNLDHLYGNPNMPGTLRARSEQDPPIQQYYVLP